MKFIPGLALGLAMTLAASSVAGAAAIAPRQHGPGGLFGGRAGAEGDMVDLAPGETVVLRLAPGSDGALTQTLVAKGGDAKSHTLAEGELRLSFTGGGMPMLQVESRYPHRLHYKAKIGSAFTSVCPLIPGVASFESWQQPIARISVGRFREVGDDFNMCV